MNGVTFGNYHSWDDWKLLLKSKEIGFPEAKTITIDVPGADGVLDLTEALSGKVMYENRTLTFAFLTTEKLTGQAWADHISTIATALHGRRLDIVLDEDPDWTYSGRCSIDIFETSSVKQEITIVCDCDPYKVHADGTKKL